MLFRKHGFPEEGELVMCTVTNIQYNSVFAKLDEYDKQGMIHISEISPGRIRNIRDYVREGKVVVCKVLRITLERGHIDLSLRRVTDAQRRNKVNSVKQEQLAEKIVDFVCKKLKLDLKQTYSDLKKLLFEKEEYPSLYSAFDDVVNADLKLTELGVDKKLADELEPIIRQRIKPPEVHIIGSVAVQSYESNGVEIVKEVIKKAETAIGNKLNYLGGGKFGFDIKSGDYKIAEKTLQKVTDATTTKSKLTTIKIERE